MYYGMIPEDVWYSGDNLVISLHKVVFVNSSVSFSISLISAQEISNIIYTTVIVITFLSDIRLLSHFYILAGLHVYTL